MTDLKRAYESLEGHSLVLCKGDILITDDGRGISTLIGLVHDGKSFDGFSAADTIVGKAAAMLFVKLGVTSVHAVVMSASAMRLFEYNSVIFEYDTITDLIVNRKGDGPCPMEAAVSDTFDVEQGICLLTRQIDSMR
ncbi:MAG: DUF1893 domain-containing protein [Saccharofermentans sp.]|jgi:hypothetical protein|nr:DUF1893 domain-containing protein [Mageeibacillus sp.]MCI1263740.1 DUF1893 domain-containing protein [Saccharofermentans sp.]MCI1274794.1 DUF1893 domain-containing protein [Saccharofermentans sp.]MCI1769227.1 DUF1893 domain-containing protein [Mageeibacillus sp.]MCI2044596.1 DUF1893 domain-containing protein [Mageeibacillus sp.]